MSYFIVTIRRLKGEFDPDLCSISLIKKTRIYLFVRLMQKSDHFLAKNLESKLELPCKLFPQKSVLNLAPENLCQLGLPKLVLFKSTGWPKSCDTNVQAYSSDIF